MALKIGGCEAVRDLYEAKQFGAKYIIAPMVESDYALSKFVLAKNKVYRPEEEQETDFLFNLETITGYENREALVARAGSDDGVEGVVFGRTDFTGSLGQTRTSNNDETITDYIVDVAKLCAENQLDLVVGGGVSLHSIPALRAIREVHLTRFETRKIVFDAAALDVPDIEDALLDAVHFEVLWLINKREYYSAISREDEKRIERLENEWGVLSRSRG
jgi:hypothetical protein